LIAYVDSSAPVTLVVAETETGTLPRLWTGTTRWQRANSRSSK